MTPATFARSLIMTLILVPQCARAECACVLWAALHASEPDPQGGGSRADCSEFPDAIHDAGLAGARRVC